MRTYLKHLLSSFYGRFGAVERIELHRIATALAVTPEIVDGLYKLVSAVDRVGRSLGREREGVAFRGAFLVEYDAKDGRTLHDRTLPMLGFRSVPMRDSGASDTLVASSQVGDCKVVGLYVDPDCARYYDVLDAKVGVTSLLDGCAPIPAHLFSSLPGDSDEDVAGHFLSTRIPLWKGQIASITAERR